ncbi:MAG: radical SAM protein, partial [Armatimonadetes bacterium]|nr:radical SAM protein [Armatimonadota bacterium]
GRGWAVARSVAHSVVAHPHLLLWYLRTRSRRSSLRRELRSGSVISSRPLGITLKPTYCCNLRCSMCSFAASGAVETHPRDSLPVESWAQLVADVAPYKPYIWFTGGEPTLYRGFISLLRCVLDHGMLCGVTTNGTLLERLADEISLRPMHILVVSVDGPEPVHDRVRGIPTAFKRVSAGVRAVRAACRRRGRPGPAIVLNCSISPGNYREAAAVAAVARDLGVDCINVQHLWMMTDAVVAAHNARWGDEHSLPPEEWAGGGPPDMDPEVVIETVNAIRRNAEGLPVFVHPDLTDDETRTYYASPEEFVRRTRAACAWLNTDVLPNGDISPCFGVVCGNMTRDRFADAWNGEAFRRHRERLTAEGDLPICARCCAYWRKD